MESTYSSLWSRMESSLTTCSSGEGEKSGIEQLQWQFLKLRMECEDLRELDIPEYSTKVARADQNLRKNRYRDIVPFDDNRVKLPDPNVLFPDHEPPLNDYINASWINGTDDKVGYIAAQGPLRDTVVDFWRMVHAFDINTIVMLTKINEENKLKCSQYWPNVGETPTIFGKIKVENLGETQPMDQIVVRQLKVTKPAKNVDTQDTTCSVLIDHIQLTGWPDKGVPDALHQLTTLIHMIHARQMSNSAPILIHCSAGCGRTGSIVALMHFSTLLKDHMLDSSFAVYELVMKLRKQRVAMVQSADQYILLHRCISHLLSQKLTSMEAQYINIPVKNEKHTNGEVTEVKVEYDEVVEAKEADPVAPPRPKRGSNTKLNRMANSETNGNERSHSPQSPIINIPPSIPPLPSFSPPNQTHINMFTVGNIEIPDFPHRPVTKVHGPKEEPVAWTTVKNNS